MSTFPLPFSYAKWHHKCFINKRFPNFQALCIKPVINIHSQGSCLPQVPTPLFNMKASSFPWKANKKSDKNDRMGMDYLEHIHTPCTSLAINSTKLQGKLGIGSFEWETWTQAQQAQTWLAQQQLGVMGYPHGLLQLKPKLKIASSSFCCIFFPFQEISRAQELFSCCSRRTLCWGCD